MEEDSLPSHEEVWDAHTILSSFGISERIEPTTTMHIDIEGDIEEGTYTENTEVQQQDRENQQLVRATFKKIELLIPLFLLLLFRLVSQVWMCVRFANTL